LLQPTFSNLQKRQLQQRYGDSLQEKFQAVLVILFLMG